MHIKLRAKSGSKSAIKFSCSAQMSWTRPLNASFSFPTLDLVIGPIEICKGSLGLFGFSCSWVWLILSCCFSLLMF